MVQVESVASLIGELHETPGSKHCRGMQGLLEEADEVIRNGGAGSALDAALILEAQKLEHYEIATYGSLRAYARELGFAEAEEVLAELLDQEIEADERLSHIAQGSSLEQGVNAKARP